MQALTRSETAWRSQSKDANKITSAGIYTQAKARPLTYKQEIDLSKRILNPQDARDAKKAKDCLVMANQGLVRKEALSQLERGLLFDDLIQEGNIGLVQAAERYDYRKGFRFSTFAVPYISYAMRRATSLEHGPIYLPLHVISEISDVRRRLREHEVTNGITLKTIDEMSRVLGMPETQLASLLSYDQTPLSLDAPLGNGNNQNLSDHYRATDHYNIHEDIVRNLRDSVLDQTLNKLTEQEHTVIALRFGISENAPKTMKEIGIYLRLTRNQVLQIETQALKKLRAYATTLQLHELCE